MFQASGRCNSHNREFRRLSYHSSVLLAPARAVIPWHTVHVRLDQEHALRLEIFDALRELVEARGGFVSRSDLAEFSIRGARLPLIDRNRGIRNPADFTATLSILSKPDSPYADAEVGDSLFGYDYRAGDIDKGDNVKLRRTADTRLPFILLRWVQVGNVIRYVPVFPVFTVQDDPVNRRITIALDESLRSVSDPRHLTAVERRYAQQVTTKRLHQPQFRSQVLIAYENRCAMCRLGRVQLLEAAHIVPDTHEHGTAEISNGLSLCRIHHAAYDHNLIGVSPDMKIHVGPEIMSATNEGPVLEHGLQNLHQVELQPPISEDYRPSRQGLELRFEEFKNAGGTLGPDTDIALPRSTADIKVTKTMITRKEFAADR